MEKDSNYSRSDISEMWNRFFQDLEFVKCYPNVFLIQHGAPIHPPPLMPIDSTLISLLQIKLLAILDYALIVYIRDKELSFPKKLSHDLYGRITFLQELGEINDGDDLHKIRKKRNKLSHTQDKDYWNEVKLSELYNDIDLIEKVLLELDLVHDRPKYEFVGGRKEDEIIEKGIKKYNYYYGLKLNGKEKIKITWVESFRIN